MPARIYVIRCTWPMGFSLANAFQATEPPTWGFALVDLIDRIDNPVLLCAILGHDIHFELSASADDITRLTLILGYGQRTERRLILSLKEGAIHAAEVRFHAKGSAYQADAMLRQLRPDQSYAIVADWTPSEGALMTVREAQNRIAAGAAWPNTSFAQTVTP